MDQDMILKTVQKYLSDVPLILTGTGTTIPHGIPGMNELARFLIEELNERYKADPKWEKFSDNLLSGMDLESALTGLELPPLMLKDITECTWKLISLKDLDLFKRVVLGERLPFGKLLAHFYRPHPQCLHVITTNYDRIVEYSCDQIGLLFYNLFSGQYLGELSSEGVGRKHTVNILKVHGSLDWFENEHGKPCSISQQRFIWDGFTPKIIPPGSTKYQATFQQPYRDAIHQADERIKEAKGFLCLGYGFNDEHIQTPIISAVQKGIPIVTVTKSISEKAASLICNNAMKSVIINEDPRRPDYTEFIINREYAYLKGVFWTIDGLLKIIT